VKSAKISAGKAITLPMSFGGKQCTLRELPEDSSCLVASVHAPRIVYRLSSDTAVSSRVRIAGRKVKPHFFSDQLRKNGGEKCWLGGKVYVTDKRTGTPCRPLQSFRTFDVRISQW
jgi:hypothetical protein